MPEIAAKTPSTSPKEALPGALPLIDPLKTDEAMAKLGKKVQVQGKLIAMIGTNRNKTISYLNFENVPRGGVVGIVKKENLAAIEEKLGGTLQTQLAGKTVVLRGVITEYRGTPQIEISEAEQIQIEKTP
ncbi:MAG: hypothetical protein ACRCZF_17010 [Gemmataceae bacterium]